MRPFDAFDYGKLSSGLYIIPCDQRVANMNERDPYDRLSLLLIACAVLAVCCWLQSARQLHRTLEWSADQLSTVPRLSTSELNQARAHTSMLFSMWLDSTMSLLPAQVRLFPDDSWLRTRMSTLLFSRPASVCISSRAQPLQPTLHTPVRDSSSN